MFPLNSDFYGSPSGSFEHFHDVFLVDSFPGNHRIIDGNDPVSGSNTYFLGWTTGNYGDDFKIPGMAFSSIELRSTEST